MSRLFVIGWIVAGAVFPVTASAETPVPSFGKDVAPILYAKCVMCHRPGEVAPMSLTSYNEVRPWARAIKSKVVSREMPPWHAEGESGKWRNDRRLSEAEIEKIVKWVDAGAPRGNDSNMPAPPQLAEGWNHPSGTPPDVIIEAPEMKVPAEGESPWLYAYVKLPFEGDVWVASSQVVPGNRPLVHHVMVSGVTLPPDTVLDAEGRVQLPPGASIDGAGRVVRSGSPAPLNRGDDASAAPPLPGGFYGGWEPGVDAAVVYPQGTAERISGTHFLFNLHYQANGRAASDKTRIGLWLQKGPVTHALTGSTNIGNQVFIVNDKELIGQHTAMVGQDVPPPGTRTVPNIPAFAENYRLAAILPVRDETRVYAFQPHMHLRGRSMKYTVVYPDGREEVIANVPKYDFNWQIIYELANPIVIPEGSTIRVEAAWDNSAKNKWNPKPDQEVLWGEQSWDEMFSPIIRAAVPLKSPIIPTPPAQVSRVPQSR